MNFNPVLDTIKTYEAGKPIELVVREFGVEPKDIIKLASNENPHGVAPNVAKVIEDSSYSSSIYPDDSMYELKDALAHKFKLKSENVIIGAGSDQVIEFCVHSKCDKDSKVLMSKTTFAMYEIYTKQTGATILKTPSHEHNLSEFRDIFEQEEGQIDIIFLCLPNNPLGECLDADEVYGFLDFVHSINSDTLVVLDGAYQEYARIKDGAKKINPKKVIKRFDNVIYLGTFSKAYGLGGMRVGYGLSNRDIINSLHKLRPPFNITTLSLASAIEALNKKSAKFVKATIKDNFKQMSRYEKWAKEHGLEFIPSYTNFITIKLGDYDSSVVAKELLQIGIIVRDLASYGLNAIRITIGKKEQNKIVLKRLSEILKTV
jgi:histidinol-phosphate aminotransferase